MLFVFNSVPYNQRLTITITSNYRAIKSNAFIWHKIHTNNEKILDLFLFSYLCIQPVSLETIGNYQGHKYGWFSMKKDVTCELLIRRHYAWFSLITNVTCESCIYYQGDLYGWVPAWWILLINPALIISETVIDESLIMKDITCEPCIYSAYFDQAVMSVFWPFAQVSTWD